MTDDQQRNHIKPIMDVNRNRGSRRRGARLGGTDAFGTAHLHKEAAHHVHVVHLQLKVCVLDKLLEASYVHAKSPAERNTNHRSAVSISEKRGCKC